MEEYNHLNENSAGRGSFLYASPVLAPPNSSSSSPLFGRSTNNSSSDNQQTQMPPLTSFHLQSEAHPVVKTEAASTSQKFHYPLLRTEHQTMNHHQEGNDSSSSNEVEAIKAKIIAHPQYSNLLQAYMDCQKVKN